MRGAAGYSLLELMIALAIMVLVVAVAAPAIGGSLGRMTLQSDARTLALALRELRERAMDRQIDVRVTVSGAEANVVGASDGTTVTLAPGTVVRASAGFLVSWDGRIVGTMVVSRGAASVRLSADPLTGRLSAGAAR